MIDDARNHEREEHYKCLPTLSRRLVTAETQGQNLASPFEICSGERSTSTGFSAVSIIPSVLHTLFVLLVFLLFEGKAYEALETSNATSLLQISGSTGQKRNSALFTL
jgi:hypothetical protein